VILVPPPRSQTLGRGGVPTEWGVGVPDSLESDCLLHDVFKTALIQDQLVSFQIASVFAAISERPSSACSVAAYQESNTWFAE
jgi:hypothetical protein